MGGPDENDVSQGELDHTEDAAPESQDVAPIDRCEGIDCDDGVSCTVDSCDPSSGVCVWVLSEDHCFIGGACYSAGDAHPNDPCRQCDAAREGLAWSALAEGAACDDTDACTTGEQCTSGLCLGEALVCGEGEPCLQWTCDSAAGCESMALEDGALCDDDNPCTLDTLCAAGACTSDIIDTCDDGNPCTDDACEPASGCTHTFNEAPCDDGQPCTSDHVCSEGVCSEGEPTDCDDGDICTIDFCDDIAGCVHLPTQNACCTGEGAGCDDGDPCTTASCDESTGECIQTPNTETCDDGDACTTGDVCSELNCLGTPLDCDDGNPCTDDLCSPVDGCVHVPQDGGPCDDNLACTTGDVCSAGECIGDASECACTPEFGDAVKATFIEMGATGLPGEGLNLDGDGDTCSPEGDCSDGIDNSLSILAGIANESIADAVATGDLNFLIELRESAPGAFLLSAYTAELAPEEESCDVTSETCNWWVDASFLDEETCMPVAALNATIDGTSIVGGGPDAVLPFALPLGDSALTVSLTNLQFQGELVYTDGQVSSFSGVFGGAVPKTTLEAAINSVPDEDLPLPKAAILGFMGLLENDIDSDGDGTKDALSLGLKVSGIDAMLTGSQ